MPQPTKQSVTLRPVEKSVAGSKVRTQFNKLVKQLEAERQRLAGWHDALPTFKSRMSSEVNPLGELYNARLREMAFLFDDAWQNKKLTKKEREKLSSLICDICETLGGVMIDESLDDLYTRHSGIELDFTEGIEDDPAFKALADILDEMLDSAGGLGEQDDEAPHDEGKGNAQPGGTGQATPPKPSAKKKRQAAEEVRLQQSVREIFRKLVSTLHPDRETDPAERARKTELMQRVNVAYGKNDLLGLLELQFEIDQIDVAGLEALGDDRIKQYNKMLKRQVEDVRREIADLESWLAYEIGLTTRFITPAYLAEFVDYEVLNLQERLGGIERDLQELGDLKALKALLKSLRLSKRDEYLGEDFF